MGDIETHYFECACGADKHLLRFTFEPDACSEDAEIYASMFINHWRNPLQRIWVAIKYIFGCKCNYGHFDCWIMEPKDAHRMIDLCQRLVKQGESA